MKKSLLLLPSLILCANMTAATDGTKSIDKETTDSLSYSIGVLNYDARIKKSLSEQFGLDSLYYDAFIEGYIQGANSNDKKEIAKILGFQIGMQCSDNSIEKMSEYLFKGKSEQKLNKEDMVEGFIAAFTDDKDAKMDQNAARSYMQSFQQKQYDQEMATKYADWKKQNEDFLKQNAKKKGVKTTKSGLQYKITKKGKGEKATDNTQLKVSYTGTLIDGTQFDSSYKTDPKTKEVKNTPFECTPSSNVIEGWKEILRTVPIGTKCTVYIPSSLGYKSKDLGDIKPYSTLIFEIEITE